MCNDFNLNYHIPTLHATKKEHGEYVFPLSMTFRRNSNCVSTFFLLFEKKSCIHLLELLLRKVVSSTKDLQQKILTQIHE